MNYLAHFHLSDGNQDLLVGALLGDFVKGPLTGLYPCGIEQGIHLHRKIDAFTDQHRTLRDTLALFEPRFRRYGGIMLDIACDHFLSAHWSRFHHLSLPEFSNSVYATLDQAPQLPQAAQAQARRLVQYDVLSAFSDWQTVEAALHRVSARLQRDNPLPEAAAELERHYATLEAAFLAFYPQLVAHCETVRRGFTD